MSTYKNKTSYKQVLPNIGEVEPNGTITTEAKIENVNFEEVKQQPVAPAQPVAPVNPQVSKPTTPQVQGGNQ